MALAQPDPAAALRSRDEPQLRCLARLEQGSRALRLDKFLYFIRFAKSRAKSVALIEAGHMRIDGRPVMSIRDDVCVSQTITLAAGGKVRAIRVLAIPARRGPAPEARACYEDLIAPEPIDAGGR